MAKFSTFKGDGKQPFRFRFEAEGHTLSSEGYAAADGRDNGIQSVQTNAVLPDRYERLGSKDDKYYFVLKAGNHEVIAKSRLYDDEAEREIGIFKIVAMAHIARIVKGEAK